MAFLDTLKDTVLDLAQTGVAKSKQLAEIAKLKASNMAEEDTIKRAYIELGKLYYAEKGTAPDGAYIGACERITAARAAIETNNDRIAELKASGGVSDEEADAVVPAPAQAEPAEAEMIQPEEPAEPAPECVCEDAVPEEQAEEDTTL